MGSTLGENVLYRVDFVTDGNFISFCTLNLKWLKNQYSLE